MFYLTNFCRICISSDGALMDLYSKDHDLITLKDKLEECTRMVIREKDLSTMICAKCVRKLQTTYSFQKMCTRSNEILQGYVGELIGDKETNKNGLVKSELQVTLTPLSQETMEEHCVEWYSILSNNNDKSKIKEVTSIKSENRCVPHSSKDNFKLKKKRVSKGQRCSLLKKLLSTMSNTSQTVSPKSKSPESNPHKKKQKGSGGLKDLLVFIKSYDFGQKPCSSIPQVTKDITPLDKLEHFSKTFFFTDFSAYRNTILSVINEHKAEMSDDEEMFNCYDEDEDQSLWQPGIKEEPMDPGDEIINTPYIEQLVVEPEIRIKEEFVHENEDEPDESEFLPSDLVQTCYEENYPSSSVKAMPTIKTELHKNGYLHSDTNMNMPSTYAPSSLELLQQFTNKTKAGGSRKPMNPMSLKCRTRGQPFINPQLMEQFMQRSFKCDKCSRSFKSPGYLHSHCTKMGH